MAWVNTSPLVKTYSLEEFWALPDPPDHSKLELIAGVLYISPPPEYTHDYVVKRLNRLLILELARLGILVTSTLHEPQFGPANAHISNRIFSTSPKKLKLASIPNAERQPI